MLFNKVGGGAEKVKIDGQTPSGKLNLKTMPAFRFLPDLPFNTQNEYRGSVFHPILKEYFVYSYNKNYKSTLPYNHDSSKNYGWEEISVPENRIIIGSFIKNKEAYIVDTNGYILKMSDNGDVYTQIGYCGLSCSKIEYLKGKNEVYLFGNKTYKYNLNTNIGTEVKSLENVYLLRSALVTIDNKICAVGYEDTKDIKILENDLITEKKDALPYEFNYSYAYIRNLNGNINLLGGFVLPNENVGYSHFLTDKNFKNWERLYDVPFRVEPRKSAFTNTRENTISLIGINRETCYEILNTLFEEV